LKLLLRASADKGAMDEEGGTPLHVAAREGRKECVELLLRASADRTRKTDKAECLCTPLLGMGTSRARNCCCVRARMRKRRTSLCAPQLRPGAPRVLRCC
jgi:ankyrin repeat protein